MRKVGSSQFPCPVHTLGKEQGAIWSTPSTWFMLFGQAHHIRRLGLQLHQDSPPTPSTPADNLCVPLIMQAYHVLGGAHIWTGQAPDHGDQAGFQGAPGGRGCVGCNPGRGGLGGGTGNSTDCLPFSCSRGRVAPVVSCRCAKLCSVRHSPSLFKAPNYTAEVNCAMSSNAGS